jgi:hypothetical protein
VIRQRQVPHLKLYRCEEQNGRTVNGEGQDRSQADFVGGRDHWGRACGMAMAGGGVKPGVVYGSTNDLGTEVKDQPVKLGDLFHTYLRALGIDSSAS